ncbi:MAG: hypothetical protein RL087_129 [Pseudomonadota bacterium]|jgi:phosphatidate cytidylyltransferase
MLKQRVITALALLAVLLPALFYPDPAPFAAVALLLVAAAAWEWARLNQLPGAAALATAALCVALCAGAWAAGWLGQRLTPLWALAAVLWVAAVTLLLRRGPQGWSTLPLAWRWAGGVLALWLTWLAVAQARVLGINVLLSVLTLVWAADIAAYFAGRAFGLRFTRTRLAPSISPGKSWEGAWGGWLGVLALGALWAIFEPRWQPSHLSLYGQLAQSGWWLMLVALTLLTAMSVAGDLVESLVKRSAGVKDSSGLLPGHGGVLDRIDALLPTLPMALLFVHLFS